jgi:hypothetical protein
MPVTSNMAKCEMCGSEFRYGPRRYEGKFIPRNQLMVCRTCWDGNWGGWNPRFEAKLIAHLQAKGLPVPERNDKGWFPRGD